MTTSNIDQTAKSRSAAPAPAPSAEAAFPVPAAAPKAPAAERVYSPGLAGVIAAETAIGYVDGENGRLLYRGYPIGQLVEKGTYGRVAELLWTGEWRKTAKLVPAEIPEPVMCALRELPSHTHPMDALRTAVSVWGAWRRPHWPPTVDQARELTAFAPSALAAFHRLRQGLEPVEPNPKLSLAGGFLQQLTGKDPDPADARALDAYFIVGAEHGLNASTFTCRVIISTRSDLASAICGAIGALKGPLHGGAPGGGRQPAARDRLARDAPRSGSARRSPAATRSWASATASTAPTTRAPPPCARWPRVWPTWPTGSTWRSRSRT